MTKPKFKEITIQVPASFKYRATDEDGVMVIFQKLPKADKDYGLWRPNKGGHLEVGRGPIPKDFAKTLERI